MLITLFLLFSQLYCCVGSWLTNEAVEYFVNEFEKLELYRQATTVLKWYGDDRSSAPFITGNGFMHIANVIVVPNTMANIQENDCVFVAREYYPEFVKNYLKLLNTSYTLIVHNGDESTPDGQNDTIGYRYDKLVSSHILSEEYNKGKLLSLYTTNLWWSNNLKNPRPSYFNCIPIGLSNRDYMYGQSLNTYINAMKDSIILNNFTNKGLLLVSLSPNSMDRIKVLTWLEETAKKSNETWYNRTILPHSNWLRAITEHKFVLAPFGNGLDTNRMYEIWLMGGIPVARKSTISSCYNDKNYNSLRDSGLSRGSLPVVFLDSWDQLTKERLEEEWHKLANIPKKEWNWKILTLGYWMEKLNCPMRHTQATEQELVKSIENNVNIPSITLNYSVPHVLNSNRLSNDGVIKFEVVTVPLEIESKLFDHPDIMIGDFKKFCRSISSYWEESMRTELCHYHVCDATIKYLESSIDTLQISTYEKQYFYNKVQLARGWHMHLQYLEGNQTAVIFNLGELNAQNYREYLFGCISTSLRIDRKFFVLYIGFRAASDVTMLITEFVSQYAYFIRLRLVEIKDDASINNWNYLVDVASQENHYFVLFNGFTTFPVDIKSIAKILVNNPVFSNFGVVYIPISQYSGNYYMNRYFPPILCFHRTHLQIFKVAFPPTVNEHSEYSFSWILDAYSVFNSSVAVDWKVNTKFIRELSMQKHYNLSIEFLHSYINAVTSAQRKTIKLLQITKNDVYIASYLNIQFYCDIWDTCSHYYMNSRMDNYLSFLVQSMDSVIRHSYDKFAISQPLLWHYAKKIKKPILQLGVGNGNSTIILRAYTARHKIELVTVDDDANKISEQISMDSRYHKIVLLGNCGIDENCWLQFLNKVNVVDWGLIIVNRDVKGHFSDTSTLFDSADYVIIDGNYSAPRGQCEYYTENESFSHKSHLIPMVCSTRYNDLTFPIVGELENNFINYINYLIDM